MLGYDINQKGVNQEILAVSVADQGDTFTTVSDEFRGINKKVMVIEHFVICSFNGCIADSLLHRVDVILPSY